MAKSAIELHQKDAGEVNFSADFGRGLIRVTVREPLSIAKSSAEIAIPDFFELAANVLLESVRLNREQVAKFAADAMRNGGVHKA